MAENWIAPVIIKTVLKKKKKKATVSALKELSQVRVRFMWYMSSWLDKQK